LARVRFHLSENALERVCFAYAPLLEAVFSLHVLAEPQHHPLHHGWVRQMRTLPAPVRRELGACSFALGIALPDPLARFPTRASISFEEGLAELRALPEDTVAREFQLPAAEDAGGQPPDGRDAMRQAREDPPAFLERLCLLLEEYWEAAFAGQWERLEPRLADSVADAGRLIATDGLYAFVATLGPRIRIHREDQRFDLEMTCTPDCGGTTDLEDVDVAVPDTFTFVPSAFSWPHLWASIDPPWPLGMTYHAPFVEREARPRVPPADLVRVLRACGDDVRLRALRWIAERPRSTQELAPLVGITESALSKHLRQLADAGVLDRRRDGYYVLYHLRRDRLEALSDSLLAYLNRGAQNNRQAQATSGGESENS
jgi:DNA-binding transcriptional ArsR family regulator